MDREPEELQHLRMLGIYREAAVLLAARPDVFGRISAAFVLPLSLLFLAHVHLSHLFFSRLAADDRALDNAQVGSASEHRLLARLVSDYAAILAFKAAYLVALLALSLLSTAGVVFSVASLVSSKDGLTFRRVVSVVPRVWRRLIVTFLVAFLLVFAYHAAAALVITFVLFLFGDGTLGVIVAVLFVLAYLVGLIYLSVVWHLASVISVLEDSKGFAAMRRGRELLRGKEWTASAILVKLGAVFVGVEWAFRQLVVKGTVGAAAARVATAAAMALVLCSVVLFALVVQTVVYIVCKAYHHETIDKSDLSDHLEVYLGDYVPLRPKDVQLEQFEP